MAKALTVNYAITTALETAPSDSARRPIVAGLIILAVFFGGFGTWAAIAPLNSAIVSSAVVKVEGNRKSVQHLDGGIVKEIDVQEGERVKPGDVLLRLDDTETRAQVEIFSEQLVLLEATEARLQAELAGDSTITFPPDLTAHASEPTVRTAIDEQTKEFENRAVAVSGQKQVLDQRIAQLRASIAGSEALRTTYQEQLNSVIAERESIAPLLEKGLMTRDRTLQLDRTEAGIRGQISQALAEIAKDGEAIGENEQQIASMWIESFTYRVNDLVSCECEGMNRYFVASVEP